MLRLLIIDDDNTILRMMTTYFERHDFEVVTASDGHEGLKLHLAGPVDIVITDILMPGKEGFETIRDLKKESPDLKIIAMSGGGRNGPDTYLDFAKTFGADVALQKPVNMDSLLETVNELLNREEVG